MRTWARRDFDGAASRRARVLPPGRQALRHQGVAPVRGRPEPACPRFNGLPTVHVASKMKRSRMAAHRQQQQQHDDDDASVSPMPPRGAISRPPGGAAHAALSDGRGPVAAPGAPRRPRGVVRRARAAHPGSVGRPPRGRTRTMTEERRRRALGRGARPRADVVSVAAMGRGMGEAKDALCPSRCRRTCRTGRRRRRQCRAFPVFPRFI